MQLMRLKNARESRIPQAIGRCNSDGSSLVDIINEAQERLVYEGGDEGWWGSWFRMVFNVDSATNPYITAPRIVARLIVMDVCNQPVPIQNEFYEFLQAGIGLQPTNACSGSSRGNCNLLETYDRGGFPTFFDLVPGNKRLRIYITDLNDVGRRILIQGTDQNGMTIYSLDGTVQVKGIYLNLTMPFVDTPLDIGSITGIQKDSTIGQVQIFELDTSTQTQRIISTMEPSEQVAGYRRYFINGLPQNCCQMTGQPSTTVQVTAMAKLAFIPVIVDTDYLVIQNLPALKEECLAVKFGENDDSLSAGLEDKHHRKAIKLLNGELEHWLGNDLPAINFAPFGSAFLWRQRIGSLT